MILLVHAYMCKLTSQYDEYSQNIYHLQNFILENIVCIYQKGYLNL